MKKGFTLIELLVVVAIIGMLSAIVMTSLNQSRTKARDSVRKQTLVQMRNTLELYYTKNGAYPSTGGTWYTSDPAGDPIGTPVYTNNGGNWIPGLVASGVISKLPQDPLGGLGFTAWPCSGVWHRAFLYKSSNGSGYELLSHCAVEGTISTSDTFYDPEHATFAWEVCAGTDCN